MTATRCYRCNRPLRNGRSLCSRCWRHLFEGCVQGWDAAKRRNGTQGRRRWHRKNPHI
jgi:predicted amidophosphoribosyltransferase